MPSPARQENLVRDTVGMREDQQHRSFVMSRVRSRGNRSTELRFIELMKMASVRGWRRNSQLLGRPDFVFQSEKVAVFIDGCFWHNCPRCVRKPRTNSKYWSA